MIQVNHPAEFSVPVGWDLYLNPNHVLTFQHEKGQKLCEDMTRVLGAPDLWFNGSFYELLWGHRAIRRDWRPRLHGLLSGGNGKVWNKLWLPWRSQKEVVGIFSDRIEIGHYGLPQMIFAQNVPAAHNAEVLDFEVELLKDTFGLGLYAKLTGANSRLSDQVKEALSAFGKVLKR